MWTGCRGERGGGEGVRGGGSGEKSLRRGSSRDLLHGHKGGTWTNAWTDAFVWCMQACHAVLPPASDCPSAEKMPEQICLVSTA